jgi:hypothetical protein
MVVQLSRPFPHFESKVYYFEVHQTPIARHTVLYLHPPSRLVSSLRLGRQHAHNTKVYCTSASRTLPPLRSHGLSVSAQPAEDPNNVGEAVCRPGEQRRGKPLAARVKPSDDYSMRDAGRVSGPGRNLLF